VAPTPRDPLPPGCVACYVRAVRPARLHLVDGTFELYRAHFSPRPARTFPDGRDGKATLGLVDAMLSLLHDADEAVTHLAIAFDHPIRSFRNDLFAGYKDDTGVPPELAAQFGEAEDAARALGLVTWVMDRWEADDALATAARRFGSQVDQVRILSPDKDLGQLLDGARVVQVDRIRRRELDVAALADARGVAPDQVPALLALVGDDADGIPGLPGFGEKSAAALLRAFGTIDAIPDDPERWPKGVRGAPRLAATLAASREDAALYQRLATLACDVPLAESLDALRFEGVDRARFAAWAEAHGYPPNPGRVTRWRADAR
jgi:5'-3' exonuclease